MNLDEFRQSSVSPIHQRNSRPTSPDYGGWDGKGDWERADEAPGVRGFTTIARKAIRATQPIGMVGRESLSARATGSGVAQYRKRLTRIKARDGVELSPTARTLEEDGLKVQKSSHAQDFL